MGLKGKKIYSIINFKCPRCHDGDLFETSAYAFKGALTMPKYCQVCHQKFELEPGFYWGSIFISYAIFGWGLFGLFAAFFFGLNWEVTTSFILSTFLLILLYVPILRLSRSLWINFFVKYDKNVIHE